MKLKSITIALTLISAATVFGAVAYNGAQMASEAAKRTSAEVAVPVNIKKASTLAQLQQVAVVNVQPATYQAEVIAYGEAKPHYQLLLASDVSGRVDSLSAQFESGQMVERGTVLATIDAISYQLALTQAQANVAQAKLNLLAEQREGQQAKSEWQRSGLSGEPNSPLVLRAPQLAQVQAALENAKLELKKAQQDVAHTQIRAPFAALIVSRDIQPGSYVQAATQVATLYSIDEVEVKVPLSDSQWRSLPAFDNAQLKSGSVQWPVTLQSSDGNHQWQGRVQRIEQHLAQDTRQRSLVVVVEKPLEQQTALYPGTFVKISIRGKALDSLWRLPASAISQQGDIWLVDKQGLLHKLAALQKFEKDGYVYVRPAQLSAESAQKPALVVKRPLSHLQVGMQVAAKVEG